MAQTRGVRMVGVEAVMERISKAMEGTKQKSYTALIEAGILIRRSSIKENPTVPAKTFNLRHSWFTVTKKNIVGAGTSFKGEDKGLMSANHASAIGEEKSKVSVIPFPTLAFGFSAYYATWVHEGRKKGVINYSQDGSGPKFLEEAIKSNEKAILLLLQQNMRIK